MSLFWNEARVIVRKADEGTLPENDVVIVEMGPEALEDLTLVRLLRAFVLTRALGRPHLDDEWANGRGGEETPWDEPVREAAGEGGDDFDDAFVRAWDAAADAWSSEAADPWDDVALAGGGSGQVNCSADVQVFVCGCGHVTVSGEA